MKLRLAAIAVATLLAASGAQAQSSVTLYGVADVGIEYLTHADTSNHGLARMASGNLSGSRWGVRGTEDLGGGMSALFVLESGFDIDTGTSGQGGRLFGRQAYTGLATRYGRITLGRQNNILYDTLINYDPMAVSPRYSVYTMDTTLAGRYDNAAKYVARFGGFTASAMYAFARGTTLTSGAIATETAGDARSDRAWSGSLEYSAGPVGMTAIYDQQQGTTGVTGQNPAQTDRRLALAATYTLTNLKVFAGYRWFNGDIGATAAAPAKRTDLWWLGASYQLTPSLTASASGYLLDDRRRSAGAWSAVGLLDYAFSKRTDLYASVAYIKNQDGSRIGLNGPQTTIGAAGTNQLGALVGMRHKF